MARSPHHEVKEASLTALTVALNVVPVAGPVMSSALAAWEGHKLSERVEAIVEEVIRLGARVDEAEFDRKYVETPEFVDAVLAGIEAGRRTSDQDKRCMIAGVLIGAATRSRPAALDVQALLETLSGLTPGDLRLARLLWEEAGDGEPMSIVRQVTGPADYPDRDFHLKRLESAGLISERTGADYGPGQMGQYLLTSTFHRLIALLQAGGAS